MSNITIPDDGVLDSDLFIQDVKAAQVHILSTNERLEDMQVVQISPQNQPDEFQASAFLDLDWRNNLFVNFTDLVISKCSEETKVAWQSKEEIKDIESFY